MLGGDSVFPWQRRNQERWEVFLRSLDFLATLRSLCFGCDWLLVVAAPYFSSGPQITAGFRDLRTNVDLVCPPSSLSPPSLLPPVLCLDDVLVDCSEASGLYERGRRLSDSFHPQIHKL